MSVVEPRPLTGEENMARDEALLDAAAQGHAGCRVYRWSRPTLSLGYFQRERPSDPALDPLPAVRRLTGGGAIVHDREWTYAVALPKSHPAAAKPVGIYDDVHAFLIEAFADVGVSLVRRSDAPLSDGATEPFLCFSRGDERDLLAGDADPPRDKVVGSAQRRRRGAVLQHGSILVAASRYAPDLAG
ncbi:MAG: lipoate--protein ligase, partial [Planctomycetota bacterium]